MEPFNISVLDVDEYIKKFNIREVTSTFIYENSTNSLHKEGLYSELIFGEFGDKRRKYRAGYINLNTKIFNPIIYRAIITISNLYEDIISGRRYAVFDSKEKDFVLAKMDDEGANTGMTFFKKYFDKLNIKETPSIKRNNKIKIFKKYKKNIYTDKLFVMPAGLRELEIGDDGNVKENEIANIYKNVMNYSLGLELVEENDALYDNTRYHIQKKVDDIYKYIENIISGKHGLLSKGLSSRSINYGTRNVITSSSYDVLTPDDPQYLKPDETFVGTYQTAKSLLPITVHALKTLFFEHIFDGSTETIQVITDKFETIYDDIDIEEIYKFIDVDKIEDSINKLKNVEVRYDPVVVENIEKEIRYLYMIYDLTDRIHILRNLDEFKAYLENNNEDYDENKLRFMTWIEMLYMATYVASIDKHALITRYPVIQDESCYPTKIHLKSTTKGRVVKCLFMGSDTSFEFNQYPIIDLPFHDTISPHLSKLKGLGGDFDGDTTSFTALYTVEANEEIEKYLESKRSVVNQEGTFVSGSSTDVIDLTLMNMARDP